MGSPPGLCVGAHVSLSVCFCAWIQTYVRLYVRHYLFTATARLKIAAMWQSMNELMGKGEQCNHVTVWYHTLIYERTSLVWANEWTPVSVKGHEVYQGDGFLCVYVARECQQRNRLIFFSFTIAFIFVLFFFQLPYFCQNLTTNQASTVTFITIPTCHQRALGWALLHEHHVLQQWAVCTVSPCSCCRLSQVWGQVATREERRAEGEGWLQTTVLLGWGHLENRDSPEGEGWIWINSCWKYTLYG